MGTVSEMKPSLKIISKNKKEHRKVEKGNIQGLLGDTESFATSLRIAISIAFCSTFHEKVCQQCCILLWFPGWLPNLKQENQVSNLDMHVGGLQKPKPSYMSATAG